MIVKKVPDALKILWSKKVFETKKSLDDVRKEIAKLGCNPSDNSLHIALTRASEKYLTRKGVKGNYTYIQKYASKGISLTEDILPDRLKKTLQREFDVEIKDLEFNYGTSGICTAFLLRKILEKLIFLTFAKNGLSDKLKDKKTGEIITLSAMLRLSVECKISGKPFLMPKTAKSIEGIKFLGDSAAHNPLSNTSMQTIVPQMPYIITAYDELSKKL